MIASRRASARSWIRTRTTAKQFARVAPAAAAGATGVLVGGAIFATQTIIGQVGPASVALLRYTIASCVLVPAVLVRHPRFARADVLPIALLGIAQFGAVIVLLNLALEIIPAARVALLFSTMPLLALLIGGLSGSERATWHKILGLGLTTAGVAIALIEKAVAEPHGPSGWAGELLALASALVGALCSVGYRRYLGRYPIVAISTLATLASILVLVPLAAREDFFRRTPALAADGWVAVLFIGVSSAVGYYLWLWALARATPATVTAFLALSPLTAAILGWSILQQDLPALLLVGVVLVALGLRLAQRSPPRAWVDLGALSSDSRHGSERDVTR